MARGHYETGRLVKVKPVWDSAWLVGVVTQSKPLRVRITERHPVWHGAELRPVRVLVMERTK
jgi:hypothetical protein